MVLKNRVAIVTGGKRGIGLAIARRFVSEGAKVIIADIIDATEESNILAINEGASHFIQTDVGNESDTVALVEATLSTFGRLDILVNNAGIEIAKTILTMTVEEWDQLMNVNLTGAFLCSKAAIPVMKAQGRGVIINVASELGLVGAAGVAAYCASKGGVVQLSKALAIDHAQDGIRVNCVCPGPVATEMLENVFASSPNPNKMRQDFEELTLLNRLGRPEEIASAATFLASDESSYMTGANLVIDGGWTTR